ncbi:beta-galactosidase [Aquimarina agarilytica]|uniref:beta-galactosidase n=1 Tax=Aquimarina agarilytica TaxID=1087449 RepID=UPI000289D640|nr:beta-galactosidase [Aquimarina agarilytica]
MKHFFFAILLLTFSGVFAQSKAQAKKKIKQLSKLIDIAQSKKIDVSKEEMSLRTAKIFLKYAAWDEQNKSENERFFDYVHIYKEKAKELAKELPSFEIKEVNLLLDKVLAVLQSEIDGEIKRKKSPEIHWDKLEIKGNKVIDTQTGKPVFLADWIWKPKVKELTEYYGNMDGFFFTHGFLDNGTLKPFIKNKLVDKPSGQLGSIFLNHLGIPEWAKKQFPNLDKAGRRYTAYDIDHPGARELNEMLLKQIIPLMKGKQYSSMYMMTNEPHWHTASKAWNTGEVTEYTREKFKKWLSTQHTGIKTLNTRWGTSFKSFSDVEIEIPISEDLKGTPKWYDWIRFNQVRVNEWFSFLHHTIKKYDPKAKTHLKIMTHLWSENKRNSGIDLEALSDLTDILGNDAGAYYSLMWGKDHNWEDYYNFNWNEISMSYDFMKSIGPNKINYNSEGHFLSTVRFRDLYMKPEYARLSHWLAVLQGMNIVKNWFWFRNPDGSLLDQKDSKGYGGSNMQQPRIVHEVTSTFMDLNAHAEDIDALQNLDKPLRLFYSKTAAINTDNYMDHVRELYEEVYFEGVSIGFVTQDILKNQGFETKEVVLISNTEFVTDLEFDQLQSYLDKGGTIVLDHNSLTKNQYGEQRLKKLSGVKGKVIYVSDVKEVAKQGLKFIKEKGLLSEVSIKEINMTGRKGCVWRSYKKDADTYVVNILNLGKQEASLVLNLSNNKTVQRIVNLLNGKEVNQQFQMKPQEIILLELKTN